MFHQMQFNNLVNFVKYGSPYRPLLEYNKFMTMNDNMTRLQANCDRIIRLMKLYQFDHRR